MKYGLMPKVFGKILDGMVKEEIPSKSERKDIRKEYKEIISHAKDIGSDNNLISSYLLAAYFISMNRVHSGNADENLRILDSGMRKSKLLKAFMGNADGYFSEKKMAFRRKWSAKTKEKHYENDWVVDVIEPKNDEDFVFGFDYLECGVCKLCHDENCPQLAKYLCKLDFMLVEIIGIKLKRTMTLADGCEKCDFRFYKS